MMKFIIAQDRCNYGFLWYGYILVDYENAL